MGRRTNDIARVVCLLSWFCLFSVSVHAAAKLPGFFTDNMVLQRDMPVPIWGWADPDEKVTVFFGKQTKETTGDASGAWMVKLDPLPASVVPEKLIIKAANGITLSGVVVGDVWICSGQSNMEFAMSGVMNRAAEIAAAEIPGIRHLKIPHVQAGSPQSDVKGVWRVCSPKTVAGFTAVGFFFARKLHHELQVPIGLIGTNWGGTRIEPWTPPVGFRSVPELATLADRVAVWDPSTDKGKQAYDEALKAIEAWLPKAKQALAAGKTPPPEPRLPGAEGNHQQPTKLYNAMVHPLVPFAIRGAIWYQGEANGGEGVSYFHKMQALIQGWRQVWGQGDFPFYFVQLANWRQANDNPAGGDGWAKVREAQRQSLAIPNTGMAVIIDIGDAGNIHPRDKQDVGLRLARWALAKTYGQEGVVVSGPLYKSHKAEANTIRIEFDHVGSGLMVGEKQGLAPTKEVPGGTLKRFAIAGQDKKWYWADARIDGNTVVVSSPKVDEPVAVRYAYAMNPAGCNLYNKEGLPASPFRTDDW